MLDTVPSIELSAQDKSLVIFFLPASVTLLTPRGPMPLPEVAGEASRKSQGAVEAKDRLSTESSVHSNREGDPSSVPLPVSLSDPCSCRVSGVESPRSLVAVLKLVSCCLLVLRAGETGWESGSEWKPLE